MTHLAPRVHQSEAGTLTYWPIRSRQPTDQSEAGTVTHLPIRSRHSDPLTNQKPARWPTDQSEAGTVTHRPIRSRHGDPLTKRRPGITLTISVHISEVWELPCSVWCDLAPGRVQLASDQQPRVGERRLSLIPHTGTGAKMRFLQRQLSTSHWIGNPQKMQCHH